MEAATKPEPFTEYLFPLASGRLAEFYLPMKLDREDADRLAEYLRALVVEDDA